MTKEVGNILRDYSEILGYDLLSLSEVLDNSCTSSFYAIESEAILACDSLNRIAKLLEDARVWRTYLVVVGENKHYEVLTDFEFEVLPDTTNYQLLVLNEEEIKDKCYIKVSYGHECNPGEDFVEVYKFSKENAEKVFGLAEAYAVDIFDKQCLEPGVVAKDEAEVVWWNRNDRTYEELLKGRTFILSDGSGDCITISKEEYDS